MLAFLFLDSKALIKTTSEMESADLANKANDYG